MLEVCRKCELENGTYSIDDLADFHEMLDLKAELKKV